MNIDLKAALAPYRERANREILALLEAHEASRKADSPSLRTLAANRNLFRAGKRYRYAIACLTYQAATGDGDSEVPARPATWLELYHLYTLYLDDIMDEDERRRRVPSAWVTSARSYRQRDGPKPARLFRTIRQRYGASMAILDALRIRSLSERAIQGATHVDVGVREDLLELLAETDLRLSDGQGLDIDFEARAEISEADYERMSGLKTGVLYVAAARTGALLADAPPDRASAFEEFARRFALAFQDRDDLLGSGIIPSRIGGSKRGDIEKGKRTRLFAIAMAAMPTADRKSFLAAYGKGTRTTAKDVRVVRGLLRDFVLPEMTARIEGNVSRALAALRDAKAAEPHASLLEALVRDQLRRQE